MAPARIRKMSNENSDSDVPSVPSSESDLGLNSHGEGLETDILEPLAVVGLSLKFPQDATSAESFWNMLLERRCASTEFPKDRMNIDAFYHPDRDRQGSVSLASCRLPHPYHQTFPLPAADQYIAPGPWSTFHPR